MPKSKLINLIPQDEFEKSTLGKVLKWALSTFRTVVIITELIVMSAFMSRFWLDSKNSDLNEEITISKSQILAFEDIETKFRRTQKKLAIANTIYSEPETNELISNILNFVPQEVVVNSVSLTEGQIQIKAYSFTERAIAQFLVDLEESARLDEVTLTQVTSSIETDLSTLFTITAKVKPLQKGLQN